MSSRNVDTLTARLAARWKPPADAACLRPENAHVNFTPERIDLFTDQPAEDYDAGREAVAVCRTCPRHIAARCLEVGVARNDKHSIMGGAGGARRRALRRRWGTPEWAEAAEAHWASLDGQALTVRQRELLMTGGAGRTHGRRSSFAAGCRCSPCSLAAGVEGALASAGRPRSVATAVAGWLDGAGAAA